MNDLFESCYNPNLDTFLTAVEARTAPDARDQALSDARRYHAMHAAVTAGYEPYRLGKGKQGGGRFAKKGTIGVDILRALLKGDGAARTEVHKTFTKHHNSRDSKFGKGPITPENLNKWATISFGPRPRSGDDANAWDAGKRELGVWVAKLPAATRRAAWSDSLVTDKPRVTPDTPNVPDGNSDKVDVEPIIALLTPHLNVAKQDETRLKDRGRDATEATAKRATIEDAIAELYDHQDNGGDTPKTRALIESLQADLVTPKDGDPKTTADTDKQYADALASLPGAGKPDAPTTQELADKPTSSRDMLVDKPPLVLRALEKITGDPNGVMEEQVWRKKWEDGTLGRDNGTRRPKDEDVAQWTTELYGPRPDDKETADLWDNAAGRLGQWVNNLSDEGRKSAASLEFRDSVDQRLEDGDRAAMKLMVNQPGFISKRLASPRDNVFAELRDLNQNEGWGRWDDSNFGRPTDAELDAWTTTAFGPRPADKDGQDAWAEARSLVVIFVDQLPRKDRKPNSKTPKVDGPATPVTQDMVDRPAADFGGLDVDVPNHIRDGIQTGSGTKESPFVTNNVESAVFLLANDQHVQLTSERQVSTLLDELAAEVQRMKAAGEKAKPFDLCKVTVPGTSLFCAESKGIPRIEMPQLGGVPIAGTKADALPKNDRGEVDLSSAFIDHLRTRGIDVKENEIVDADVLKASQNELNGTKIVGMMGALEAGTLPPGAIFVSRDDYVVDGHHRWAANVGAEYTTGKDMTMPVHVIDADIIDVLAMANAYALDMGIPQASVGTMKTGGAPDAPNVPGPADISTPDAPNVDTPSVPDAGTVDTPSTPPHNTPSDGSVQFSMNSDYLSGFGVKAGEPVHARYRDDRYAEIDVVDSAGKPRTVRVAWSQLDHDSTPATQERMPGGSGITFTSRPGGVNAVTPEERAATARFNPRSETLDQLSDTNLLTRLGIVDAFEKDPPDIGDARLLQTVALESQQALKGKGIDTVTLWRGMPGKSDSPFPGDATGITSWTTNPDVAADYSGENGTLFKAEIPVDQILSWDVLGALRTPGAGQPGSEVLVARDPSTSERVRSLTFPFVESSTANVGKAKFDPDKVFADAAKQKPVAERTVADLLAEGSSPDAIRDLLKRSDLTDSQRAELHRMLDAKEPKPAVTAALALAQDRAERQRSKARNAALKLAEQSRSKVG